MDDTFLTTEEVLEYLQINLRTIYRLLKAGEIPAVRIGRQWRFRKADIDAWLESRRPHRPRSSQPAAASPATRPTAASTEVATPASLAPAPTARTEPLPGRPRILVADDEESIREVLAKTLELAEYVVETVTDGQSALERLRNGAYDLFITDLRMPGMDGLAVIREARRLRPTLPVVIITGYSTEASAIEAINLGVSGYLTKPFRVPKVLAVAAKALGE